MAEVHTTGVQFSTLWARIEAEDEVVVESDDGYQLSMTIEETEQLIAALKQLVTVHAKIYDGDHEVE